MGVQESKFRPSPLYRYSEDEIAIYVLHKKVLRNYEEKFKPDAKERLQNALLQTKRAALQRIEGREKTIILLHKQKNGSKAKLTSAQRLTAKQELMFRVAHLKNQVSERFERGRNKIMDQVRQSLRDVRHWLKKRAKPFPQLRKLTTDERKKMEKNILEARPRAYNSLNCDIQERVERFTDFQRHKQKVICLVTQTQLLYLDPFKYKWVFNERGQIDYEIIEVEEAEEQSILPDLKSHTSGGTTMATNSESGDSECIYSSCVEEDAKKKNLPEIQQAPTVIASVGQSQKNKKGDSVEHAGRQESEHKPKKNKEKRSKSSNAKAFFRTDPGHRQDKSKGKARHA